MAWGLIGMNSKAGGGGSSAEGKTLLAIPSVTVEGTAFTYDGNEHGPTVGAYDEELIQAVGTKKTNAGEYNVVFSLRDTEHYAWEDGTIENKAVAWSIAKASVAIPSVTDTSKTYNRSAQSPTIASYDNALITVTGNSQTNVGSYKVTMSLADPVNYMWSDGTTTNKTVSWTIAVLKLAKPTASTTSFSYDGKAKTLSVSNYNSTYMTQSGTTSATASGSYTATYALKDKTNTQWADGSTANVSIGWTIGKVKLTAAQSTFSQSGTLTYTGSAQSPTISGYNATYHTISGNSGTNAGSYTAKVALKDTTNYTWSDGTTAAKSVTWTIGRAKLTSAQSTFSQSGSLTYTGKAQSPTISGYNATYHTISGNSGTNAGSYTAKVALKDTNHAWSDGTTATKNVTWTIGKAAGSLTISKSSITLVGSTSTASTTFTVTRAGDGTITVTSSATGVATVSLSGTTVTVTGKASGSATITVKVAAGTNHTAPSNKTASVSVTIYSATLGSNTPAQIKEAIQKGVHTTIWNVGDVGPAMTITKWHLGNTDPLSGTFYPFIIGFDHNASVETGGKKSIHFSLARHKSSGHNIGFTAWAKMGSTVYTWGSTNNLLSRTILNTTGNGNSSIGYSLIDAINEAWVNVIEGIKKYSRTGVGTSDTPTAAATTNKFWLMSEFEVFGSCTYSHTVEKEKQVRYTYYANGNSRIRYKHSATSTANPWWLRSPHKNNKVNAYDYFCVVQADGSAGAVPSYVTGNTDYAVVPCFAITA